MSQHGSDETFWHVVEDCLTELHGLPRPRAQAMWQDLLRRLRKHPEAGVEEMMYHFEPLYVANDLAGRDLDDQAIDSAYRAIRSRYWSQPKSEASATRSA